MDDTNLKTRIAELENRMAIRELIDNFSILADRKDIQKQMKLLTVSASIEAFKDGRLISKLVGQKEIGEKFEDFLKSIDTAYHFNGQNTVVVSGDKAAGILYCKSNLITTEKGKE